MIGVSAAKLLLALALPNLAFSAGLTGNENFAFTRSLASKRDLTARSDIKTPSFVSALTFDVEDANGDELKTYMSPFGDSLTKYTFTLNSGSLGDVAGTFPVTVVNVEGTVDCDTLGNIAVKFENADDVWDESVFMTGLILQGSGATASSALGSCLTNHWNTSVVIATGTDASALAGSLDVAYASGPTVPQGPYIATVSGGTITLTTVYRVYKDENLAFTTPAVPDASGSWFYALTAQVAGMSTQSVPVPSRLYTLDVPSPRPLEGKRVAVKDIYDIAGLRTGCGNRAYWSLYAPRNESAVAVQRLIDQGAIIIGKVKTSQFANGESPTAGWVDQISPFNPRGDGYLDPSTSSAGSGASIGAYPWVDHTIGSDSGGSIRDPAANQGVYGMRPSHGAISLTGVMPLASVLDTAGFFARDAISFQTFGKAWYGDQFQSYPSFPKRVFVPDNYFPVTEAELWNPEASQVIYEDFIGKLVDFLGGYIDNRSLPTIWNNTVLDNVGGLDMYTYTNLTYPTLIGYYQYTYFGVPFINDYQAANGGRTPFLDPAPAVRWPFGAAQGPDGYASAVEQKTVFMDFIADFVLTADNASCSDALFLYPINAISGTYRNIFWTPPTAPWGFFNEAISPYAETPEIVIPLGQVPYNSTIDNFTEYSPVAVAIIAAVGCDYMLLDLAAALQDAGIIGGVITGRTPFSS